MDKFERDADNLIMNYSANIQVFFWHIPLRAGLALCY